MGVSLVIASGLFPPYTGQIARLRGGGVTKYMGYHFLFEPPSVEDIRTMVEYPYTTKDSLQYYSFHIIATRIWVQISVVSIATVGLFFLFSGRRHETEINQSVDGDGS